MSDAKGVWVVYEYDGGPFFMAAFPTAEGALIDLSSRGHGKGVFVHWGEDIQDALERTSKEAKL